MSVTLAELAEFLGSQGMSCEVDGDASVTVSSVATLEEAEAEQLSFLSNPKYENQLAATRASAVLVKPDVTTSRSLNLLRTTDPYAAVTDRALGCPTGLIRILYG